MARKSSSTLPDEDFDAVAEPRASSRAYDDSPLDARILALDDEEDSPFLRGQKRVPVRRGALPRKAAGRIKLLMLALLVLGAFGLVAVTVYRYATQSWRFRVDSSDNIEVLGTRNVTRAQVLDALGADIDRNIFHISLDDQKRQLEEIPWIQSATVMRLLSNRIRVEILERVPVAFVEVNGRIALVDSHGVIMDMPPGAQSTFSFPVVVSMSENEPLSTRSARMKIYTELVHQLDSSGANYSRDLSEVDVSDPDDVKVMVSDPKGAVLVHLGSSSYLERYQIYVNHIQEWRAQFSHVDSVSLRYDGQIIMNPDAAAARAKQYVPTGDTPAAATPPSRAVHAKKTKKR
jgi:cell division protein FtsQ